MIYPVSADKTPSNIKKTKWCGLGIPKKLLIELPIFPVVCANLLEIVSLCYPPFPDIVLSLLSYYLSLLPLFFWGKPGI